LGAPIVFALEPNRRYFSGNLRAALRLFGLFILE
jgi:hypothetical protein